MAGTRTHLLLFAIDDLRESIIQTLIPFPQISYSFAPTLSDLIKHLETQPPAFIVCRPAARYSMPVGIALVLICTLEEYDVTHFANEQAVIDLLIESDLARLPLIAQREERMQRWADRETRRLRTVVEHAPHGVIEAELASRQVRWANRAMHVLFGYSAAEMTTLLIEDLHPSDLVQRSLTPFSA